MHRHRAVLSESRIAVQRRRQRVRITYVVSGAFVLLIILTVAFLRMPFLRVKTVDVLGTKTISEDDARVFVFRELSGNYAWLLPKDNTFLFSDKILADAVLSQFPRAESVIVRRKSLSRVQVSITERAPVGRWCGAGASVSVSENVASTSLQEEVVTAPRCILMDATGMAYELENSDVSIAGSGSLPIWYGLLADNSTLPVQFLVPKTFASTRALVEAMTIKVNAGALVSVSIDVDDGARATFENGFSVLFGVNNETGVVMGHLLTALSLPIFSDRSISDFEYLDLRFGDKLYYRLRSGK